MDIKDLPLEKLKALAYDQARKYETAGQALRVLNQQIKEKEEQCKKDEPQTKESKESK